MILCNVCILPHALFHSWHGCSKIGPGRFDVAAAYGGAALEKCFRSVSNVRKSFERRLSQNSFRHGIIPLQHGEVPARQGSIATVSAGNVLQHLPGGGGVSVSNY